MFDQRKQSLSTVVYVLVDGGYTGAPFVEAVKDLPGATVQVAKRSELHTCRHSPALGSGVLVRLAVEMPALMEKLRTQAHDKHAIRSSGISRIIAADILTDSKQLVGALTAILVGVRLSPVRRHT